MANCEPGSSNTETSKKINMKGVNKTDDHQLTKLNGQNEVTSIKRNGNNSKSNELNEKSINEDDTNTEATKIIHNEDGRKRRRKIKVDDTCPVCGITIREGELECHLKNELDRLNKLPQLRPLSQRSSISHGDGDFPSTSSSSPQNPHLLSKVRNIRKKDPGWDTFQRILLNRRKRMRAQRLRGHNGDDTRESTNPACPVCGETISEASPDSITDHVEACLKKSEEEESNELLDVDVEDCDGDDLEEYEWCGQTRVRATSMLRAEGQLHALGTKVQHCEEDVDVDIEDDEEELPYGQSQYTTEDLPPPPVSESDDDDEEEESLPYLHDNRDPTQENLNGSKTFNTGDSNVTNGLISVSKNESVIKALKERIRELESENDTGRFTCLVCHGQYVSPLVSVVCWHVHCEQCWLHSLAAKKLCPQCSAIISPVDLRKIYI